MTRLPAPAALRRALCGIALFLAAGLLSCAAPTTVRGIAPVLDAGAVERSSSNRARIMDALTRDAGYGGASVDWYDVTVAGFNYVDDSCALYFDELFKLNRQRDAAQSLISVTGQTTNALLAVTGASKLSMAVVAQAFGLGSSLTDIVAGTYLYSLPPATTKKFIAKTMAAYRDGAAKQRGEIQRSPTVAYSFVRGYLDLCLPATIEGQLVEHVGAATAAARTEPNSTAVTIEVSSDNSGALREPKNPIEPLPPVVPRDRAIAYEKLVLPTTWVRIQRLVCVAENGKIERTTRTAIRQFLAGRGEDRPNIDTTGVTEADARLLETLIEKNGGTCQERNVPDATKAGALSLKQEQQPSPQP
ncbi:hypothetical protein HHL25_09685 [Rhizobium sp. S-51]|uniref:Lipoprotein n=1 Tax=Rhizobium terricola TaxID=2728849 RepID=A0A7Y0AVW1_9HYPH|nr:hypothetical protein [Rhizobium terricola]NML74391.1 hypothetical protein [Rhizobium terricola]